MFTTVFQPRYIKEADLLAKNARKLLHRKKDTLSDATVAELHAEIDQLEAIAKTRDEQKIKEKSEYLDKIFSKASPHRADSSWRENCEVLLVAFVIAIGIRAYFLQPFKIPTGSMQPTLNGIIVYPIKASEPLPGFFKRNIEALWLGRSYVDVVSEVDDQVVNLQPVKRLWFLNYTRIECRSGHNYMVHVTADNLESSQHRNDFGVYPGNKYRAGQPIARGYVDTGDQVFVDKFTYHFRAPRRADVFVFNTRGIRGIPMNDPEVKSQFYIKRLAAISGDVLRIDQPRLFINGELAHDAGFVRVMNAKDGYHGYGNIRNFPFLSSPSEEYTVPPNSYFALGDNSFNSSDSRNWGQVPAENVVGRGLFVYWPLTSHWGFVR